MEGRGSVSGEVLARYAADAAREVDGVRGVVEGALPRQRGVRVTGGPGGVEVELHLGLVWDAHAPTVGRAVQEGVRDYLERMAGTAPSAVDVVFDEIGSPE